MTTVREIDRLVVADDAVAARLWPRLGPRVRAAYAGDRDAWVSLRRTVEAGATLPPSTLSAQRKVFSGWARAFRAAAGGRPKRSPLTATSRPTVAVSAPATAAAAAAPFAPPSLAAAAITTRSQATGGAGTAVAGGLVLAGLIAIAARRKRA